MPYRLGIPVGRGRTAIASRRRLIAQLRGLPPPPRSRAMAIPAMYWRSRSTPSIAGIIVVVRQHHLHHDDHDAGDIDHGTGFFQILIHRRFFRRT